MKKNRTYAAFLTTLLAGLLLFAACPTEDEEPPPEGITGFDLTVELEIGVNVAKYDKAGSFSNVRGGTGPYTYDLVSGVGDTDNGLFSITGADLMVDQNITSAGSKSVRVKVEDSKGLTFTKACTFTVAERTPLKLHYTFAADKKSGNSVTDATGKHTGTLNHADIDTVNNIPVLKLGPSLVQDGEEDTEAADHGGPYFDLGEKAGAILNDKNGYTVSAYINIGAGEISNATGDECSFVIFSDTAKIGDETTAIWFYVKKNLNNIEIDLSKTGWNGWWGGEENGNGRRGIFGTKNFTEDEWHHILYRQQGGKLDIWVDGVSVVAKEEDAYSIATLKSGGSNFTFNSIGNNGRGTKDPYLENTMYADFRIYDAWISDDEVSALANSDTLTALKGSN